MRFSIYGRWAHDSAVSAEALARIEEALPLGCSAHVWVERKDVRVLGLYLEVDALDDDEAIELGRVALEAAVSPGPLVGRAVEISSVTDEGQSVWPVNTEHPGASRW